MEKDISVLSAEAPRAYPDRVPWIPVGWLATGYASADGQEMAIPPGLIPLPKPTSYSSAFKPAAKATCFPGSLAVPMTYSGLSIPLLCRLQWADALAFKFCEVTLHLASQRHAVSSF